MQVDTGPIARCLARPAEPSRHGAQGPPPRPRPRVASAAAQDRGAATLGERQKAEPTSFAPSAARILARLAPNGILEGEQAAGVESNRRSDGASARCGVRNNRTRRWMVLPLEQS